MSITFEELNESYEKLQLYVLKCKEVSKNAQKILEDLNSKLNTESSIKEIEEVRRKVKESELLINQSNDNLTDYLIEHAVLTGKYIKYIKEMKKTNKKQKVEEI